MKKALLTLVAAAALAAPFAPALAQEDDKKFVFNGMVRGRYEYLSNYFDLTDNDESGDINDDSFGFAPYRVMVGLTGNFTENVSAHVDLQYAGVLGDRLNPQTDILLPVGQAITPYQTLINPFPTSGIALYQGYIDIAKIGGSNFGARVGRAEHTYNTELFLGDNDYYNGTSFDGVRAMWQAGRHDVNAFYYKIAETNVLESFGADDSDLFGATYDFGFDGGWGKVGGYVIAAQDMAGYGPIFFPDSKLYTVGAHWTRPMMGGEGTLNAFDWNVEFAMQTGDAGDPFGAPGFDLSGYVGEGWFGWNLFRKGENHGRLHAGFYMASGDDPNTTDEVEDFVGLYGDYHANNRLGDLDFIESTVGPHNITNVNVGYQHWLGAHSFMAAVHYNMLTEDTGFTDDKLGMEVDLGYNYAYSKNVTFAATVGQFMPDTGLEEFAGLTESDPVTRITAGLELRW